MKLSATVEPLYAQVTLTLAIGVPPRVARTTSGTGSVSRMDLQTGFGRLSVNAAPRPALFSTLMPPPCASRMRLQMLSPRP